MKRSTEGIQVTITDQTRDHETTTRSRRERLTLPIVLAAVLVVPMSISGTAVALPTISSAIGGSPASQQWVVNLFNLTFACFTLVWGSLADRLGHGRLFAIGAAIFAAGSLLSALAPNIAVLDGARALAGLGGAAIFSCGSAILSSAFAGAERLKAFAYFGTTAGVGVAIGPTISGLLTDSVGWRSVFVAHAVILAVVVALSPVLGLSRPTVRHGGRFDVLGASLMVVSLLALMTAIVEGNAWAWVSGRTLAVLALAVIAFVAFLYVESRVKAPFLDLSVLLHRRFMAFALVPVAASFGFVTLLTYLPTYLQFVNGFSSGTAGLTVLIMTVPVVLGPILAGKLVAKGVNATMVIWVSFGCLVVGDLGLLLSGPTTVVGIIAVPLLLAGSGMGLSAGLIDGQALALVEESKAGMAAGVINTLRLGSEAIAVAIYASVLSRLVENGTKRNFASSTGDRVDTLAARAASGDRTGATGTLHDSGVPGGEHLLVDIYNSAFHSTLIGLAIVGVLLAAAYGVLQRRPTTSEPS